MKPHRLATLGLCASSALALSSGCAADSDRPSGPVVEIAVAPLSLPNTLGVEYAIAVFNDELDDPTDVFYATGAVTSTNDPILVWQQPSVTSNRFGSGPGGDISYIGPCDASLGGDSTNYVALALQQVYVGEDNGSQDAVGPFAASPFDAAMSVLDDQNSAPTSEGGDDDADFENPCPYDDPCILPFPCKENEDTQVVFNLTIMRDADQGFFDVAVNFEDIFCSAKVDCSYDDAGADPIELLFDGDGARGQTAVFGLACTNGAGTTGTVLHLNGARVECGEDLGTAIDATAYVSSCTADGGLYGAVTGSTKDAQQLTLPVAFRDGDKAIALPTGEYASGLVAARIDANTLIGVVGDARAISGASGRGITLKVDRLALWKRPDSAGAWELGATYLLPDRMLVRSLADITYDAVTHRVWINAAAEDQAGPVYLQKDGASQAFAPGAALLPPDGYRYCALRHAKGDLAVAQCTKDAQNMVSQDLRSESTSFPTQESVAALWVIGAAGPSFAATILPIADLNLFPEGAGWTATLANIVSPTKLVGTVFSDKGAFSALQWTYLNGKWEPSLLAEGLLRVEWVSADVIALASAEGQQSVRRWDALRSTWLSWPNTAFELPGTSDEYIDAVARGYSAQHNLLYGLVMKKDKQTLQLWSYPLPVQDTDAMKPQIVTTDMNVSYEVLGDFASAGASTLMLLAKDGIADDRYLAARYAPNAWAIKELTDFATGPAITPRTFATSAAPTQGCEAAVGTSLVPDSKAQTAATWALDGTGDTITPKTYQKPDAILAVGAQVGTYVRFDLDPTIVGNAWDPPSDGDAVWQYAIYSGAEALDCGAASCQKVYWNTAVGFDPSVAGCHLIAEATAAASPGLEDGWTPDFTTYPLISVDVPLTSTPTADGEAVELLCRRHPLGSDEVQTIYTDVEQPQQLCHRFDGTTATSISGCEWTPYPRPTPPAEPSIPTATVSGIIFTDANGNGAYDTGDTPIVGATLTLSPDTDDPFANLLYIAPPWTGTSDANGQISIDGVATGVRLCKTLSAVGHQTTTQCGLVIGAPDVGDEVVAPGFAMRTTCTPVSGATNDATCDAIDDDCDGYIDEDADPLACDPCLTDSDCCSDTCTGVCTGAPLTHVVTSLTVQGPADLPSDYACITEVTGALTIEPNPSNGAMPLMNFASLQSAGAAHFYTSTAWEVAHFPVLTSVGGAMQVYGLGGDSFLSVPALASVGNLDILGEGLDLEFSSLSACGDINVLDPYEWRGDQLHISFPALQEGPGISVSTATATSNVSFPVLTSAVSFVLEGRTVHPGALHIPLLTSLSGHLQLVGNGASAPNLWTDLSKFAGVTTVGNLIVRDNGALIALGLTALTTVTTYFDVSGNPALDDCLAKALWTGLTTKPVGPVHNGNSGSCSPAW